MKNDACNFQWFCISIVNYWREIFEPVAERVKRNRIITIVCHFKTALGIKLAKAVAIATVVFKTFNKIDLRVARSSHRQEQTLTLTPFDGLIANRWLKWKHLLS